jgi:CheY-like chemotaxis protein
MSSTILLADDSLTIQKVVELTFADTEYQVIAVSSGDELLESLPKCQPDIVICDVIMPGRDGYDICQDIKSDPQWLHLPVILLTGTFEPFDRDRALAAGCSEIVTKPFEAKKLVDAVERLSAAAGPPPSPGPTAAPSDGTQVAPPQGEEVVTGLEDTEVSPEWGPSEAPAPEPIAADELQESVTNGEVFAEEQRDTIGIEHPSQEFELETEGSSPEPDLELDDTAAAAEPPAVAEVQSTSDDEPFADLSPDTAETLASADITEMMQGGGDEVFEIDAAEAEEPQLDAPDTTSPFAEPSGVDDGPDAETTKTTPIHVESALSEVEIPIAETPPPPDEELDGGFELEEDLADAPEVEAQSPQYEMEEPEPALEASDEDISNAETQDFEDRPPAATEAEGSAGEVLSDSDVDRIAKRLLELAGDRIERIAWDVIPDMAEIVVRERVREIEALTDGDTA